MKDFKKLKKLFANDPEMLRSLEAQEQSELLRDLVGKKFAMDGVEMIKLKGEKGDTPVKGKDYLTQKELRQIIQEATPIKGEDYFTLAEVGEIIEIASERARPIKGVDYFDGVDADEENIIRTVSKDLLPLIPKKEEVAALIKIPKVDEDKLTRKIKSEINVPTLDEFVQELKKKRLLHKNDIQGFNMNDQRWHGGGSSALTVTEVDGSPSVSNVNTIKFSNGSVTDDGNGVVTVTSGGSGGFLYYEDQTPNDDSTYGLISGDVDGVNDTFIVEEGSYVSGKLGVWLNGQKISQGLGANEFQEASPSSGTFTFNTPPEEDDVIEARYMTVSSTGGIQSVVAGTNVQIDNTDPFNPIISVIGAGTGTVTSVSGVNTNGFIWSIATATTTPAITLDVSGLDAAKIADGSVSNTEFQYLNGVTSAIQTQFSGKQDNLSGLAIANVAPVGNDKVLIQDISDSDNLKYVTVSAIVALASSTPGGNDTEFQFNDGGSFGGTPKIITPDSGSTILLIDNSVAFADQADNSRRMIFDTSGVSAATTRTLTIQNVSGTVYVSGGTDIPVADGGTGASTLTGLLQGNGTSAFTAITNSSTVGQVLRVTGASTYAWGALDLSDTDAITGDLPFANLTQIAGFSILAKATTGTGDVAALTAGTDSVLRRSGSGDLAFGTLVTNNYGDDTVTYAKLQNTAAYKMIANNTNGSANMAEVDYHDETSELTYSGTITWTAGTAPTTVIANRYRWRQVGKYCEFSMTLSYTNDGSTITLGRFALPSDMPTPSIPTGFTGASAFLWPVEARAAQDATGTGLVNSGGSFVLRNASDDGFDIRLQTASGTYSHFWINGQYPVA